MSDIKRGDMIGQYKVTSDGPVATWVIGRSELCKSVQCGGSHYHCTRCGAVTGMCGHLSVAECDRAISRGLSDPDWVSA